MKGKIFLEKKWLFDPQELCCLAIVNIVLEVCEVYEVNEASHYHPPLFFSQSQYLRNSFKYSLSLVTL
jgi:hypothetical protein